jgi:hypothetical protein
MRGNSEIEKRNRLDTEKSINRNRKRKKRDREREA